MSNEIKTSINQGTDYNGNPTWLERQQEMLEDEENKLKSSDVDFSQLSEAELNECLVKAVRNIMSWQNIKKDRLKRQIKVCMHIIKAIVKGKKTFVVSAPTGFGKTILGLMIDEFLRNAEDKLNGEVFGSYILTPNKFLQDQYNDDLIRFNLSKTHAQVKGQSNYPCLENRELTFATRPCSKISISKLPKKMSCGEICPYVVARNKAILTKTTIFNYNYYLSQMNSVFPKLQGGAPFKPRTVSIFDECHTMPSILQETFQKEYEFSKMAYEIQSKLNLIESMYGGIVSDYSNEPKYKEMISKVQQFIGWLEKSEVLFLELCDKSSREDNPSMMNERLMKVISVATTGLNHVLKLYTEIVQDNFPEEQIGIEIEYTDEQQSILDHIEYLSEIIESNEYLEFQNKKIGLQYMVVDTKVIQQKEGKSKKVAVFRCEKTDDLSKFHVNRFLNYSVFMSATIGDSHKELMQFADDLGLEDVQTIINQSDFDFTKSPIVQFDPPLKLNFKEKETNLPKVIKRIVDISQYHPKVTGLIHTGNYEFQDALKEYLENNGLDDRFIFCTNNKDKMEGIRQINWDLEHAGWSNRILVGASLLEGVDLKGDLCRFNIFMKVPYLSLGDTLVRRKMNRIKTWYGWQTMISFLQGIGRGVRAKDDWCVTYLLDGSFKGFFYNYGILPSIIRTRLRNTTIFQYFHGMNKEIVSPPPTPPLPPLDDTAEKILDEEYKELKPLDMFSGLSGDYE
ncbi:ATP-dependent helicase [Tenacibaculum phage pT24]|uniref:ATP-dependent helicase n=1 Tax=Tenacibaculum phage pT24 TaxID=1880590 RepID=A0A1B4XWV3_9CAUD|nr:DNA helicase [Tenacibaculum phage pT24]BAV39279.1 ATP-dependent helicase [Tenacibaculum phage pT24]